MEKEMNIVDELKEKVHKLEYLPKKVEKIEYTEIKELKTKIENIEINLGKNNLLTKQNTDAMNKMSQTMDSVRKTMIQITEAVGYMGKTNRELAENIRQQNEKIDKLQTRQDEYDKHMKEIQKEIDNNEEKSKIDIRKLLKDNFISIVAIIVSMGILVGMFIK